MTVINLILKDPRVREISDERSSSDGFRIYLKPGWRNGSGSEHAIHEDTPQQCLQELKFIETCGCEECKKDLQGQFPFWVTDVESERTERYSQLSDVPQQHRWAFDHIQQQDCGSISCGSAIYEVRNQTARV